MTLKLQRNYSNISFFAIIHGRGVHKIDIFELVGLEEKMALLLMGVWKHF